MPETRGKLMPGLDELGGAGNLPGSPKKRIPARLTGVGQVPANAAPGETATWNRRYRSELAFQSRFNV
jgi:hypothetical protein